MPPENSVFAVTSWFPRPTRGWYRGNGVTAEAAQCAEITDGIFEAHSPVAIRNK